MDGPVFFDTQIPDAGTAKSMPFYDRLSLVGPLAATGGEPVGTRRCPFLAKAVDIGPQHFGMAREPALKGL